MWGVRLHSGTHGKSEDNHRWCPSSYTMLEVGPLVGPQPLHKLGQLASSLEESCFLSPISLEVCEEHRCILPQLALHKSCAFKLGFSECTPRSSSTEPSPQPFVVNTLGRPGLSDVDNVTTLWWLPIQRHFLRALQFQQDDQHKVKGLYWIQD